MARPEKVAVVDRVTEQFNGSVATLLTDYRGLTVTELAELRAELRKVDATYAVVKNTLTRLAAAQAGMEGLEDLLVGPTALVFCGEDPVGPAKALKAFAKDHEDLVVKGGYLDGQVLDAEAAAKLADLASREELLATLAGMMNNALAGFARLLAAGPSQMARLMAALEADGGVEAKGFSPEATATAAPAAAADAAAEADDAAAEADDAVAEASDASSASSDSSDSVDSPASEDSADEAEAADEGVAAAATEAVAEAVDTATDAVADAAEAAVETASDVAETVVDGVTDAVEAAAEVVDEATTDDDSSDEEE